MRTICGLETKGGQNRSSEGFGTIHVPLRLALVTLLNCKMDHHFVVIGLLSFVAINRGTNRRQPYDPLGNTAYPSVQEGNLLCSRTEVLFGMGWCVAHVADLIAAVCSL